MDYSKISRYYYVNTPIVLFVVNQISDAKGNFIKECSLRGFKCYVVPWYYIEFNGNRDCNFYEGLEWENGVCNIINENRAIRINLIWPCFEVKGKAERIILRIKSNNQNAQILFLPGLNTYLKQQNQILQNNIDLLQIQNTSSLYFESSKTRQQRTAENKTSLISDNETTILTDSLLNDSPIGTCSVDLLISRFFPLTIVPVCKPTVHLETEQNGAENILFQDENIMSAAIKQASKILDVDNIKESPFSHQVLFFLSVSFNLYAENESATFVPKSTQWNYGPPQNIEPDKLDTVFSILRGRISLNDKILLPKFSSISASFTHPLQTDDAGFHPYAWLHPVIGKEFCVVNTVKWPGAKMEFLDENFTMTTANPSIATNGTKKSNAANLLDYLGRVISYEPVKDQNDIRYVEPGVGRTILVNNVSFNGLPEISDYSVLGVGLTPYSKDGFAMVGPYIDGLTSLKRALHRLESAKKLGDAGCRVAKTAAIIVLEGMETTMPDYSKEPAALVVRGFRSVFRVKQLDPLACLYLSPQHRPYISQFIMDDRYTPLDNIEGDEEEEEQSRYLSLNFGSTSQSLRNIAGSVLIPRKYDNKALSAFINRRRKIIELYSPLLINQAKQKVSVEMGRHPEAEMISNFEYASWFCSEVGRQLGIMKKLRFLHDYHHKGISRSAPDWIYTLCETNVTLLAEFPDLDTSIFTNKYDSAVLDRLRLKTSEYKNLSKNFDKFHLTDIKEAEKVASTFCQIVLHFDQAAVDEAMYNYSISYAKASREKYL